VVPLLGPDLDGLGAPLPDLGRGLAHLVHLVELAGQPGPDVGPVLGEVGEGLDHALGRTRGFEIDLEPHRWSLLSFDRAPGAAGAISGMTPSWVSSPIMSGLDQWR